MKTRSDRYAAAVLARMTESLREAGQPIEPRPRKVNMSHVIEAAESLRVDPCSWFPSRSEVD